MNASVMQHCSLIRVRLFLYETGMDVNIQFMWNSNPTCVFFIFRSDVNRNKYIFALSHLGHQDEQTGIKICLYYALLE